MPRARPLHDRARLFVALERLVAEGILIAQRDTYRFADPSVRDHIARSIEPARRAGIHGSIGEKLCERAPDDPSMSLEAGLHLLDSGQRSRGADLVVSSVVSLFRSGQYTRTAASALEVAREVYEAEKR